jgi:hypothetical protein
MKISFADLQEAEDSFKVLLRLFYYGLFLNGGLNSF